MSEDVGRLEEKIEFLNRQLTLIMSENRRLRDEIDELEDTIVGLARMIVKEQGHVQE